MRHEWNQSRLALAMQASYISDVKCIESDSHSASYTSFMLDTINATMY